MEKNFTVPNENLSHLAQAVTFKPFTFNPEQCFIENLFKRFLTRNKFKYHHLSHGIRPNSCFLSEFCFRFKDGYVTIIHLYNYPNMVGFCFPCSSVEQLLAKMQQHNVIGALPNNLIF
jgi:hypothetical protein